MPQKNITKLHFFKHIKPIQIKTFGEFSVCIDGQCIGVQTWRSPKVYQLLLLIVAAGGQKLSIHHICDAMWGHQEGDQALQNFEFILRRLRQTLQKYLPQNLKANQVVQLQHGKVSLNPSYCTLDSDMIQQYMKEGKELRMLGKHRQAYCMAQKVTAMIQGGFLEGEIDLIHHYRHAWHARLCSWVDETAAYWKQKGVHYTEIISLLDTGLGIDPCCERLSCLRMQVLHQAGYSNDAIRYYRSWAALLFQVFGLEPSPVAQQAYQSVMRRP